MVKDIRPTPDGKPQKVKVKVRINLHGVMTVSSASLIEAKEATGSESPENEKQDARAVEQQQNGEQQPQGGQQGENDAPMDGVENPQQQSAEVGSGTSWTKKISAWFSGVRISMLPAAGAVWRDPSFVQSICSVLFISICF